MGKLNAIKLSNGITLPLVGYGTWLSNDAEQLKTALRAALDAGYRYIDTASLYRNENVIGDVLQEYYDAGKLKRSDIFLTTKLPFYGHSSLEYYVQASLKNLRTDYIDLYLVHSPLPTKEKADHSGSEIAADGKLIPDLSVSLIDTWSQLEEHYKKGTFKAIGVSNFNVRQLQDIYDKAEVKPHNLQIELNILFPQNELVELCKKLNISVTSYGTLGSPGSAEMRGVSASCLEHPLTVELAKKYNKSAGQILLRQTLQRGNINVIPKSLNAGRVAQNLDLFDFELTAEDMKRFETEIKEHIRLFPFTMINYHPWFPFDDVKPQTA